MSAGDLAEKCKKRVFVRPSWPYQCWSDDVRFESEDKTSTYAEDKGEEKSDEDDESVLEEPDHWLDDLDDDVSELCPIKYFFDIVKSPDVNSMSEAKEIRSEITPMVEKTLISLSASKKVFKNSYLLPVGSMAENSKVYKPDEFDFAVILPALAEEKIDIFSLLLRKETILTDQSISELFTDLCFEGENDVTLNLAKHLKHIWFTEMLKHLTSNLEIEDTSCFSDDVSVAGTFHLKRKKECSVIDLDVCFWVPLDYRVLSSAPDDIEQKDYLLKHCLDEHGLVYAILPRDEGIEHSFNSIRFATSCLEKEVLLKYGPENNRLRCYKFCKCVVSRLVPKFQKRTECCYCFESLVSSFCLKNIVLYLINNYKKDSFWTERQLPNRIVEVFAILSMCMKINFQRLSAFFLPYEIQINRTRRFNVEKKSLVKVSSQDDEKPCILPNIGEIRCRIDDEISKQALHDYDVFLKSKDWSSAEVICRLSELLSLLRTEDEHEREELRCNPGWNTYGLY